LCAYGARNVSGSVFYRSGGSGDRPRARNGQFLPWGQHPPGAEAPIAPHTNIVQRDAHLPDRVVPGVGGIASTPYGRLIKQQAESEQS
jgi:hypothetical protein